TDLPFYMHSSVFSIVPVDRCKVPGQSSSNFPPSSSSSTIIMQSESLSSTNFSLYENDESAIEASMKKLDVGGNFDLLLGVSDEDGERWHRQITGERSSPCFPSTKKPNRVKIPCFPSSLFVWVIPRLLQLFSAS